ncbi:MAG: hypothetical protein HKL80_07560 [Acidimicrobiales bacterium]|nr:hypothetical protein [Acidimicrobiales bacterium]
MVGRRRSAGKYLGKVVATSRAELLIDEPFKSSHFRISESVKLEIRERGLTIFYSSGRIPTPSILLLWLSMAAMSLISGQHRTYIFISSFDELQDVNLDKKDIKFVRKDLKTVTVHWMTKRSAVKVFALLKLNGNWPRENLQVER